jgi:hypothetical protein
MAGDQLVRPTVEEPLVQALGSIEVAQGDGLVIGLSRWYEIVGQ